MGEMIFKFKQKESKGIFIPLLSFCFLLVLLFSSGEKPSSQQNTYKYFFAGHTYQWGAPNWARMDYRLEKIPFKEYDQLWLGGDLCENVPHHPNTIHYLDTLLDLGNEDTHWAVGNHDVWDQQADFSFIEEKTGRKTHYFKVTNGIGLMVLNTTEFGDSRYHHKPHECELLNGQWKMIQSVTDTLQTVSHLVILHHHGLLTNKIAEDKIDVQAVFNFYDPTYNIGCEVRGTFEDLVYPKLVEVQKRGIQVILVGGDTGQQVKEFEFKTSDEIIFLGSGINNSYTNKGKAPEYFRFDPDKVLIFEHDIEKKKLTWEFVELNGLVGNL